MTNIPMKTIVAVPLLASSLVVASQEVEFNDTRLFQIDDQTSVTRNGEFAPTAQMIQIGTGYQTRIQIGTGSKGLESGTLIAIDFNDRLAGPVTNTTPLEVFSIPVVVTGDTQLFGLTKDELANITVGEELNISGFSDVASSVLATRIESSTDPLSTWRIEGYVANLTATTFDIGPQTIDYSSAFIRECPGGAVPASGFVEMEANPTSGFVSGQTLVAEEVHCEDDRLNGDGPAVVEGIITSLLAADRFNVGDQEVMIDSNTRFENGTIDDIELGVRVEAEGAIASTSGVLLADKIKIRDIKVRFEAPVDPNDVAIGESIAIMFNTVSATPQTRDEDGIIAAGLGQTTQVEVRGFIDRDGNLFATRVRERGNPDVDDAEIRGPAVDIADPFMTILGLMVDTNSAVFRDAFDQVISREAFFETVAEGTPVSVESAQYDAGTATISGGIVSIEDEGVDDLSGPNRAKGAEIGGRGIGVITGRGESIFGDGFES